MEQHHCSIILFAARIPVFWGLEETPSGVNGTMGAHVDAIQELTDTFFLTRQDWCTRAADCDVSSMSGPVMTSSSLVVALFSTFTPGSMLITRTSFSPRKFRISNVLPPFVMLALMGKCA